MNKQQLAAKIWASANEMRSKIEASEYKDYILGFIFYKFLSEKEEVWLREQGVQDEDMPSITEDYPDTVSFVRRNIGYAIQGSVLFPHMTVEDNISYVPRLLNRNDHERTRKAVRTWMGIVGLSDDLLERYPSELSGGQQQRVGIARALAASPDILLMDEPFGAVDEITRSQLQAEISRIHRETGITVLFVTHDISEALLLGTHMLVLDAGRVQQFGSPEEILARPATEFVRKLVARQRHTCDLAEDQLCACEHSGAARAEAALAAR